MRQVYKTICPRYNLAMFKFCPSCSSGKINFADGKAFSCPDCGFLYFHNVAAANGCIISVPEENGERLMFLVRGKEPAKGKLDLPGGFVDAGEGVLEGLHRELKEELGWAPQVSPGASLAAIYKLFASFPNVYPYKGISYNTCDMFFCLSAPGLSEKDLVLERSENVSVCFLKPEEIDYDEVAFDSTRRAIKAYLLYRGLAYR